MHCAWKRTSVRHDKDEISLSGVKQVQFLLVFCVFTETSLVVFTFTEFSIYVISHFNTITVMPHLSAYFGCQSFCEINKMCGLVRHLIRHKINMIPEQKVVPNVFVR